MTQPSNQIIYTDYCIHKFAEKYNLSPQEAFTHLYDHKGLQFLDECYEAEHLLSLEDAVIDLTTTCKQSGGYMGHRKSRGITQATMTNEQRFLIQSITQRMVSYVMRDQGLPMLEAFKAIYQSPKFALLCDTSTGLYTQSPLYVYSSVFK